MTDERDDEREILAAGICVLCSGATWVSPSGDADMMCRKCFEAVDRLGERERDLTRQMIEGDHPACFACGSLSRQAFIGPMGSIVGDDLCVECRIVFSKLTAHERDLMIRMCRLFVVRR